MTLQWSTSSFKTNGLSVEVDESSIVFLILSNTLRDALGELFTSRFYIAGDEEAHIAWA